VLLVGIEVHLGSGALRPDQQAYDLLVAKRLEPSLFSRDVLYRRDPTLLHVPLFIEAHAALARALARPPEAVLAWLAWPMGVLFIAGHYALFRVVSGSAPAAAMAALGSVTIRNALGGEFWGFDGLPSVATRTILAGLIPLLLLAFVAWRGRRSFPLYFLVLGALFNVHPVSAYHLAQVTAIAHVALARRRLRALVEAGTGIGLFGLGTLPYVLRFFPARDDLAHGGGLTRAALEYRFPYLLYPIGLDALLSVVFHLSLPAAAWLWFMRGAGPRGARGERMAALNVVAAASLVAAFVGLAAIQSLGVWLDRPYLDIQQIRVARLMYPVLLCGLALAYARLLARRTWRARAAIAVLVALSLVPPGAVIHAVSGARRDAVKAWLGIRPPGRAPQAAVVERVAPDDPGARDALHAWARAETGHSALFFTDDFTFRVQTRRSITGSFKDGAFLFLAGSRPFTAWYELDRELVLCRGARGRDCWFVLARRLGADHVIVDPGITEAGRPPDFTRVWARGGFEVWRRAEAGLSPRL
jgi:hypothetical protein